jgi:hypothetical protein
MVSEDEMQDRLVRIAALSAAVQVAGDEHPEETMYRAGKFARYIETGLVGKDHGFTVPAKPVDPENQCYIKRAYNGVEYRCQREYGHLGACKIMSAVGVQYNTALDWKEKPAPEETVNLTNQCEFRYSGLPLTDEDYEQRCQLKKGHEGKCITRTPGGHVVPATKLADDKPAPEDRCTGNYCPTPSRLIGCRSDQCEKVKGHDGECGGQE